MNGHGSERRLPSKPSASFKKSRIFVFNPFTIQSSASLSLSLICCAPNKMYKAKDSDRPTPHESARSDQKTTQDFFTRSRLNFSSSHQSLSPTSQLHLRPGCSSIPGSYGETTVAHVSFDLTRHGRSTAICKKLLLVPLESVEEPGQGGKERYTLRRQIPRHGRAHRLSGKVRFLTRRDGFPTRSGDPFPGDFISAHIPSTTRQPTIFAAGCG